MKTSVPGSAGMEKKLMLTSKKGNNVGLSHCVGQALQRSPGLSRWFRWEWLRCPARLVWAAPPVPLQQRRLHWQVAGTHITAGRSLFAAQFLLGVWWSARLSSRGRRRILSTRSTCQQQLGINWIKIFDFRWSQSILWHRGCQLSRWRRFLRWRSLGFPILKNK